MNILFLIHDMSKGAGTERVVSVLSNELNQLDHKITIASCQNGRQSTFKLDKEIQLYSLQGEQYSNCLRRRINSLVRLKKLSRQKKIDVIICVDVTLMLYTPFISSKKMKIVAWEHFNFNHQVGSKMQYLARKFSAQYADALVVITKADKQNYEKNIKNIKRIIQLYNPTTPKEKDTPMLQRKNIVLAVGRLEYQKGFDRLLEAWKLIENKEDWTLRIVGEGSEYNSLMEYIKDNKLKNVELVGYKEDITSEYQSAKMLVCSSRFEGLGMVLIEAQQNGLPVISFDCPEGPREIICNQKTGILVEYERSDQLAQAIVKMMDDEEMRENISQNALESVRQFDAKWIANKWENLLKSL